MSLSAVSATSATNALAVGSRVDDSGGTIAERWDGTSWTATPTPTSGNTTAAFGSVQARSATDAWAVGVANSKGLAERWDGTSWTVVPTPDVGTFSELGSVAATSATNAWAVGETSNATNTARATLIERWDGTSWSVVPNVPSPGGNDGLSSVAAISASNAWAVGNTVDANGDFARPFFEHWDGTSWSVVPGPDAGPGASLESVAATSATNAWVVGETFDRATAAFRPLIERWDGTSWSVVNGPDVGTRASLGSVAATSASNAWAVGSQGSQPLIERWDGTSWSVAPSPATPLHAALDGVAATSGSDAWAVGGTAADGVGDFALMERWDGTSWTITQAPDMTIVPDVTGETPAQAAAIVQGAGLTAGSVTGTTNCSHASNGLIVTTSPAVGSAQAFGTTVSMTQCTNNMATVPDVSGEPPAQAAADIQAADLTVGSTGVARSCAVPVGTIIRTIPTAGSRVAPGTTVNMIKSISLSPECA